MIGTGAAILGSAIIGGGASLLAGSKSAKAASNAGALQAQAANRAADMQMGMYRQTRSDLAPYMNFGTGAMAQIESAYGINGRPIDPAYFRRSPDYDFAFNEGERALNRSLAARGQLASGNALKAATKFGQGMATQHFGNYIDRMSRFASIGANAAAGAGNAGIQTGQTVGNSIMGGGQAQASGIVGSANAWGGAIQGVGNVPTSALQNYMLMNYLNRGGSSYGSVGGTGGIMGGFN